MLPELMEKNKSKLQAQWDAKSRVWAPMIKGLVHAGKTLQRFGTPTDKRFYYPVDQRRTRQTTEQMRRAEANLDRFWEVADNVLRSKAGKLEGTHLRQLLSQPKILQRKAEWVEPEPAPRKAGSKTKVLSKPDAVAIIKRLSEIYFDLERRTEAIVSKDEVPTQAKPKQKTRGTAASEVTNESPESEPLDPQPTFGVDARALKVFRTIFYTPSSGSTPGEAPWIDFVHALGLTGSRTEKLYGSVWQFSPTRLDVERAIQFHEPHPEKKIPFFTARRHGRRLHRAYGWHGGMFVLS